MSTDTNHRINFFDDSNFPRSDQNSVSERCSGRDCTNIAKNLLTILYIKKTGYFCDDCTQDLLARDLAIRTKEVIPN